jgi:uncharacterized membrane protein YqjE
MPLQSQRSVSEVLQDIVANLQEITRSELRLATTEIKEEAARTVKPVVTFGTGIVFAIYALGFLLLASVYALSTIVGARPVLSAWCTVIVPVKSRMCAQDLETTADEKRYEEKIEEMRRAEP